MPQPLTNQQQFTALTILDYLSDLFTVSPRETFTRESVLLILNSVQNDPNLINPEVLVAYQQVTAGIGEPQDEL